VDSTQTKPHGGVLLVYTAAQRDAPAHAAAAHEEARGFGASLPG